MLEPRLLIAPLPAIALLFVTSAARADARADRVIDVSAKVDAGVTSADDDQVLISNLRVGYELREHLTVSLAGQTGGATGGDRWIGGLVGAVDIWNDFGALRGALRFGGTHQHEAPRDSLNERPASVVGGIDEDITHRTAGVAGLSLITTLYETETGGLLYAGAELTSMLWLDDAGPRWTFLGGLVGGFRVDLAR